MDKIAIYVIAGLAAVILWLAYIVEERGETIEELNVQLSIRSNNVKVCHSSLEHQNELVEQYRVDLSNAEEKWNNRKPVVQVVTEWKVKYKVKETNASCQDILNAVRRYGF